MLVFTVYDQAAKAYITPFFLPTEAMAVREFQACANDPDHKFCKYAEDYSLWMIAIWDADEGVLEPTISPEHVANAIELRKWTPAKQAEMFGYELDEERERPERTNSPEPA